MAVDAFARQTAARTADLTSSAAAKGSALIGFGAGMNGYSVPITLAKLAASTIHVKSLGAVGDGTLHPLSESYPSLAAAQAVYPFATSLAQSIDWCAIQLAQLIAYNSAAGCHPDIDLGFGMYVIDADIQCYAYTHMRGRSAGTSHSQFSYKTRGYQTTLLAAAGYNGNMLIFNTDSQSGSTALSDTIIRNICFRGNWTGPDDVTNTTGRAIFFNGVYLIQNSYIEECEFHNFAQDAIYGNVIPLPLRMRRLWGRYIGGSVVRFDYSAARGSHSLLLEDIQGDFIVAPPIVLDGTLRLGLGGSGECITIRDIKHEVDNTAISNSVYAADTVQLINMDRVTVLLENINTMPSNVGGAGTPVTNSILKITGTKFPFYRLINCRMGSTAGVTDYLVDDAVRGVQVPKMYRDYSFTRSQDVRTGNAATDVVERSAVVVETTGVADVQHRYQRDAAGMMVWGDGASAPDTNLYREASNRLRTDDMMTARKLLMRGSRDLVAGDFLLTGWGSGASVAITANSIDSRWRITITAGTAPSANPSCRLTYSENVYPIASFLLVQMGFGGTGALALVVPESTSNPNPAFSQCAFTYIGTPSAGATYIFEGLVF